LKTIADTKKIAIKDEVDRCSRAIQGADATSVELWLFLAAFADAIQIGANTTASGGEHLRRALIAKKTSTRRLLSKLVFQAVAAGPWQSKFPLRVARTQRRFNTFPIVAENRKLHLLKRITKSPI
jgi:hypothetical protein